MESITTLTITLDEADQRLDRVLAERFPDRSRASLQKLVGAGQVLLNEATVSKRSAVAAGDVVQLTWPETVEGRIVPEHLPLDVVFEDDAVLALNKPPGLVVHPGAGRDDGTLVHRLVAYCPAIAQCGDPMRPGIVHRLGLDTSGIMVVAKTEQARLNLIRSFSERCAEKAYLAILGGKAVDQTVSTLIGRHRVNRKKMAVVERGGRPAVSHLEVLEVTRPASLVRVRIETGRTHQIRVHCKHIGHPVVGDTLYGRPEPAAPRQMLHALRLIIPHPLSGTPLRLRAPLPDDLLGVCDTLELSCRSVEN